MALDIEEQVRAKVKAGKLSGTCRLVAVAERVSGFMSMGVLGFWFYGFHGQGRVGSCGSWLWHLAV